MKITCPICPHHCKLAQGQVGICRARINTGEKIECGNYGQITSIALDPIEKKPLYHFYPGSNILSIGSYGCNLSCPFCQNHSISMAEGSGADTIAMMPEQVADMALKYVSDQNIGIAFTYNEPFIGYEFVQDCARLNHENGLRNVLVTNGYICEEPFLKLLPYIDAMNIDLKGFTDKFYKKIQGDLETVKNTIQHAAQLCHVEITMLIIPGENDSIDEITEMAEWIAGINRNIPLHLTRFFPRYRYSGKEATDIAQVYRLAEAARSHLKNVYEGNC